ncbi:hypothetical protein KXS07_19235 [Inquilinus limosus]|uniref:hypothetical protein n=1 Tax=Inquilinus limosus TaxID=171674 RepID=UPI0004142A9A|nr:hypothetical protein [Inquilinus limosus]
MIDPFVFLLMIAAMIWLGVQVLTQRSAIRELESRLDLIDEGDVPAGGPRRS